MKNKKALLALALVLVLGTTLVAGGTLAWFSDTDEVTNTFTVGSIEITQNETFDEANAELLPVVKTPDHNDPTTLSRDNNFIQKSVTVTNDGKNPAYVQTFVAVPAVLDNGLLKQMLGNNTDWTLVGGQAVATNVSITFDVDDDEQTNNNVTQTFNVYQYRYNTQLAVDTTTSESLSGIYVDAATDLKVYRDANDAIEHAYFVWDGAEVTGFDLADSGDMKLHVLVATQAVQAQGFGSAAEALDASFPNHPWYVAP